MKRSNTKTSNIVKTGRENLFSTEPYVKPKRFLSRFLWSVFLMVFILGYSGSNLHASQREKADMIVFGGKIYTMADAPRTAFAMAIKDGYIVSVGSILDILWHIGRDTEFVNLKGRTVLPGLIDTHVHLDRLAEVMRGVRVYWQPKQEVIRRIAEAVEKAEPGEWIRAVGYNEALWDPPVSPTKEDLDAVSPDNPVYITRYCGHLDWVNSKALEVARIDASTPDPPMGKFYRDEAGNPTGIILGFPARMMVARFLPQATPEEQMDATLIVADLFMSSGITTVHEASRISFEREPYVGSALTIGMMKELYEQDLLKLRVYDMVHFNAMALLGGPQIGLFDNRYTLRSVKLGADGALGARGAAMFEEYSDEPGWKGNLRVDEETFGDEVAQVFRMGFQPRVHAIGDYGNWVTLNAFEEGLSKVAVSDPRPVMEHAQVLRFQDMPRFRKLGVIASMQPIHAVEDMFFAEDRLGGYRVLGAYAPRTLLSLGVVVSGSSDAPASPINPFYSIHAAVTRQTIDNEPPGGWYPGQRVTRREAVEMYTVHAAYAGFEENIKGTLEPGKLADLIVINQDMMDPEKVPDKDIWKTEVLMTIVGGEIVYSRPY